MVFAAKMREGIIVHLRKKKIDLRKVENIYPYPLKGNIKVILFAQFSYKV